MKLYISLVFLSIFLLGCQQADDTIRIGGLLALTGDVAVYGQPMKQAVDLAVEEINARGGVNAKPIEIIWGDSKCAPNDATLETQKLITQDKVVAIIGAVCSSATLAAAPIAEAAGVPLISPSSTNPGIKDSGDFIFRNVVSDDLQGIVGAELAADQGHRDVAILYINNDYGVGLKDVFRQEFLNIGGNVVATESFEQSGTDFRTELLKVQDSEPDAIYLVPLAAECSQVLKQKEELGIDIPVISSEGCKDQSVIDVAGDGANGVLITTPKSNVDENYINFATAYEAKYGNEPSLYTAESYDALRIIIEAIRNSDGTRKGIKDALYDISNYPGASGPTTFDELGEVIKPYTYFEIVDGDFVERR